MLGFIDLNKPSGRTSREVVDDVAYLVRPAKVGHAGTLDPLATGVLVVPIGAATRLVEYVQREPKEYRAAFLLGCHSPTDDVDGAVTPLAEAPHPTLDELCAAAATLVGPIQQRPPAYSAVKVRGRRAYDLARRGQQVELAPRPVTIYELRVARYAYPEVDLQIRCSGGTYVRAIGRDLAARLGTQAVMSSLVRTAVGPFRLDEAVDLDRLTMESLPHFLLPPTFALASLPRVVVSPEQIERLSNGQAVELAEAPTGDELAAVDSSDRLMAILEPRGTGWGPSRSFVHCYDDAAR